MIKNKSAKMKMLIYKNKNNDNNSSSDEEVDNFLSIVCLQSFLETKKGEVWVQGTRCLRWAHATCVGKNNDFYVHTLSLKMALPITIETKCV